MSVYRVYIAEKPSQAREIAKALGGSGSGKGQQYPVPKGDVVVHALGHLLDLINPHEYPGFRTTGEVALADPALPSPPGMAEETLRTRHFRIVKLP